MAIELHPSSNEKARSKASAQQRSFNGTSNGTSLNLSDSELGTHDIQRTMADPSNLMPKDIPALQRMAGNQVVQRMVYGAKSVAPNSTSAQPSGSPSITPMTGNMQIQRKINFQPELLMQNRNKKKSISQRFGKENTWDKLMRILDDYSSTHKAQEEVDLLKLMQGLAAYWLSKYGKAKKGMSTDEQVMAIRRLLSSINAELPHAEEEAEYMESISPMMDTGVAPDYSNLTGDGGYHAVEHAKSLSSGRASKDKSRGFGTEALALVQRYKLTDAEIAAIKIYSAEDYRYINPAMASRGHLAFKQQDGKSIKGLHGWLNSGLGALKGGKNFTPEDRHKAKKEGRQHGRVAMRGLNKLPDFKGLVYRGLVVDTADLATTYQVGQLVDYANFTSSSKKISVSEGFITRELADASAKGIAKSGILLVVNIRQGGKDVSDLSLVHNEAEVLWMPGQKMRISKITPEAKTGKNYTIVEAEQVLARRT